MTLIEKSTFVGTAVVLDNRHYSHCVFKQCRIVFGATGPTSLTDNEFVGCSWEFKGPASLTIDFMAKLYSMGGGAQKIIEATFENVRKGTFLLSDTSMIN